MAAARKFRGNKRQVKAYVGLGSNDGDRVGFVQQAVQMLKDNPEIEVLECSSLYEAEPVGKEYKKWFVNAVVVLKTGLTCDELLDQLHLIEDRLNSLHNEELEGLEDVGKLRIIDLDILFFGNEVLDTQELTVPHPRLHQRAFALVPLLELSPDMMHPGLRKTVSQLHEELPAPERVVLYGTREQNR